MKSEPDLRSQMDRLRHELVALWLAPVPDQERMDEINLQLRLLVRQYRVGTIEKDYAHRNNGRGPSRRRRR